MRRGRQADKALVQVQVWTTTNVTEVRGWAEEGFVQGWPHQVTVRGRAVSTPQDPLQGPRQAATSPPPPSHRLPPFIGSQESRPLCRRGSTVLSTKSRDSEREASKATLWMKAPQKGY